VKLESRSVEVGSRCVERGDRSVHVESLFLLQGMRYPHPGSMYGVSPAIMKITPEQRS